MKIYPRDWIAGSLAATVFIVVAFTLLSDAPSSRSNTAEKGPAKTAVAAPA